jgi:hypothetical protein
LTLQGLPLFRSPVLDDVDRAGSDNLGTVAERLEFARPPTESVVTRAQNRNDEFCARVATGNVAVAPNWSPRDMRGSADY